MLPLGNDNSNVLDEEEEAEFEVLITAHLSNTFTVTAATMEEAEANLEEQYERVEFTEYGVDGHDEKWNPLNDAARRLLKDRRIAQKMAREAARRGEQK